MDLDIFLRDQLIECQQKVAELEGKLEEVRIQTLNDVHLMILDCPDDFTHGDIITLVKKMKVKK
jgi:hypothetical protein